MGGVRVASLAALALVVATGGCGYRDDGPQGWGPAVRKQWYEATQGSRLIPWSWALALERPGEPGKFFDAVWLERFRLLPGGPEGMPIGMVKDVQPDTDLTMTKLRWRPGQGASEAWLGFNCAACHTAAIDFKGRQLRIDGGPAMTDFQSLIDTLDVALAETRGNPAKWDAFAKTVLAAQDGAEARLLLAGAVDRLIAWNAKISAANAPVLAPGFARVDAFGHIFNKVALLANPKGTPAPNPADAPVSYPFLWNTDQANRVQWNGIAENTRIGSFGYGALGRNTGEVIGVYGDVAIAEAPGIKGYKSSVPIDNVNALERLLQNLKPPPWPADLFGATDPAKVERGAKLFAATCAGACHTPLARDDTKTRFTTKVFLFRDADAPGTDPWMACNAFTYEARTGIMAGMPVGYTNLNGDAARLGQTAPVANMLRTAVVGTLLGDKEKLVKAAVATWLGVPPRARIAGAVAPPRETKAERLERCLADTETAVTGYRARPLTGIWATAPYLHNGSVANLWELMLPAAARLPEFHVGSRDYDPKQVGYVTAKSPANSFRFVAREGGVPVPGNGNQGHEYGSKLSPDDRWALVEYMKTL